MTKNIGCGIVQNVFLCSFSMDKMNALKRKDENLYMDYPLIGSIILFVTLLILNGQLVSLKEAVENVPDVENDKKSESTVHIFSVLSYLMEGFICIPIIVDRVLKVFLFNNLILDCLVTALIIVLAFVLVLSVHHLCVKIGYFKSEKVIKRSLAYGRFMIAVLSPIRVISEAIGSFFGRLFGIDPSQSMDDITEEEIMSLVDEGHEQGILESAEAEMIHNIIEFTDTEVQEVMTHRKNMIMLSGDLTVNQALDFMLETVNSRFPVYDEDMDNILGVVHIKDSMILTKEKSVGRKKIKHIDELIRKVDFVPETRSISDLFSQMQAKKQHMTIVVDEYGQVSGLVTLEDILEEIVGNIYDEHDEEDTSIVRRQEGTYEFEGMTPLEEVAELLDTELPIDDFETLNGFLISLIDRIPEDDETFEVRDKDYIFKVLSVDNKIIQSVHVSYSPLEDKENIEEER